MAKAIFEGPEHDVLRHRAREILSRTMEHGGATMNAHTGEFAEPHFSGKRDPNQPDRYIVGGETSPRTGQKYDTVTRQVPRTHLSDVQFAGMAPEHKALPELSEEDLMAQQMKIQLHDNSAGVKNSTASVGTWRYGDTNTIDVDVSGMQENKLVADRLAESRGEKAIFGTNPGRDIPTRIGAALGMKYQTQDQKLRSRHRAMDAHPSGGPVTPPAA